MNQQKFVNGTAGVTLAAKLAVNGMSAKLAPGKGALFPMLTGGDYYLVWLTNAGNAESAYEAVRASGAVGDTLTIIQREAEGVKQDWDAGAKCECRFSAARLNALVPPAGSRTVEPTDPLAVALPEGYTLTVIANSANPGTGTVVRQGSADQWAITPLSGKRKIGPYPGTQVLTVVSTAGGIDAVVSVVAPPAPQLSQAMTSFVTFGDSRDQALYTGIKNNNRNGQHWLNWLMAMMGQPMRCVGNFGISNQRTDQSLTDAILAEGAAIQSDIAIFDFMAVNDLAQSSAASFINLDGIAVTHLNVGQVAAEKVIAAARLMLRAGKYVWIQAEPGATGLNAQQIRQLFDYNRRCMDFCRTTAGCVFLDHTDVVWAPAPAGTLAFQAGFLTDGTHHAGKYAYAVAKKYMPILQGMGVRAMPLYPKSLSNINANNPLALFDNPGFSVPSGGSAPTANTVAVSGTGGATPALNTPKNCKWAGPAGSTAALVSVTPDAYGGNTLVYDIAHSATGLIELTLDAPSPAATLASDIMQAGIDVAVSAGSVNASVEWQTQMNATINGVSTTFSGYDLFSGVSGAGPTEAYSLTLANQPAGFPVGTTAANKGYTQGRLGIRFGVGGGSVRIAVFNPFHQRMYVA